MCHTGGLLVRKIPWKVPGSVWPTIAQTPDQASKLYSQLGVLQFQPRYHRSLV